MDLNFKQPNIGSKRLDTYNDLKNALAWLGVPTTAAPEAEQTVIYGGYVAGDGTAVSLPSGWTSEKTGTGAYTVTHNLDNDAYVVVALAAGAVFGICSLYAINADDFDLSIVSTASSAQDTDFTFILLPTS